MSTSSLQAQDNTHLLDETKQVPFRRAALLSRDRELYVTPEHQRPGTL